jgi:hypothetical protein
MIALLVTHQKKPRNMRYFLILRVLELSHKIMLARFRIIGAYILMGWLYIGRWWLLARSFAASVRNKPA